MLLPILIFSVILHEVSHGWVALSQGDDTAYYSGRLTLNPLPHLDPLGSVIFPALAIFMNFPLFGWAKPVPVNPNRFYDFRKGVVLVSLAGPVVNFLIALSFTLLSYLLGRNLNETIHNIWLLKILSQGILLNLVLAVFNLIPIPPLDGSRVVSVLLPQELAERYDAIEPYGFFIVMGLIFTGILGKFLYPVVILIYRFLLNSFGLSVW